MHQARDLAVETGVALESLAESYLFGYLGT
jgi:hypothetical protein